MRACGQKLVKFCTLTHTHAAKLVVEMCEKKIPHIVSICVERGGSAVECRTRNRKSQGSNPLCYRFEVWACSFSSRRIRRLSCVNE